MKISREVTEDEVIASWLLAESESHRFSKNITRALNRTGLDKSLLDKPDFKNEADNKARKRLLRIARRNVLRNFPWSKVKWFELEVLNKNELGNLYTPFGDTWLAFTSGERLLSKAADFISKLPDTHDPISHALGIQKQLEKGTTPEPPILVTTALDLSKPLCIIEGNVRCVSYYLYPKTKYPVRCYLAVSRDFAKWSRSMDTLEDIRNAFINQKPTT